MLWLIPVAGMLALAGCLSERDECECECKDPKKYPKDDSGWNPREIKASLESKGAVAEESQGYEGHNDVFVTSYDTQGLGFVEAGLSLQTVSFEQEELYREECESHEEPHGPEESEEHECCEGPDDDPWEQDENCHDEHYGTKSTMIFEYEYDGVMCQTSVQTYTDIDNAYYDWRFLECSSYSYCDEGTCCECDESDYHSCSDLLSAETAVEVLNGMFVD